MNGRRNLIGPIILVLLIVYALGSVYPAVARSPSFSAVYVVQALLDQSNRYVAGKDAAIIVQFSETVTATPGVQTVTIIRDGATVATLGAARSQTPSNFLIFFCPDRATCGDWKAGSYVFKIKMGDLTQTAPPVLFQERRELRLLGVPVSANYGSGDVRVPGDRWRMLYDFLQLTYPLAPSRVHIYFGHTVDASAESFNVAADSSAGRDAMFELVYGLQPSKTCYQDPRPADAKCYDAITGFVKNRMGADGRLQGFAAPSLATSIVVESDADAAATVAHEIAHLYGIGDEYRGGSYRCDANPPPPEYIGSSWDENATNYSCPSSTAKDAPEGYSGSAVIGAYEFRARGLILTPLTSFMGNGPTQDGFWITPTIWSWLFDKFAPQSTEPTLASPLQSRTTSLTRWVYGTGYVTSDDQVTFYPWYSYMDTHEHVNKTGNYTIVAIDEIGRVLASEDITVSFKYPDECGYKCTFSTAPFGVSLPYPNGTTAFQVLRGSKIIGELKVLPNSPTVALTAPTESESVSGNYTISWEAKEKGAPRLYYTVEYSEDGEDWQVLAQDIQENHLTVDFNELPGGNRAQILVTATDGVNSAEAYSPLFNVPAKPPFVEIDSPEPGSNLIAGTTVVLRGSSYDLQDDELEQDSSLIWTSNIQGQLGRGGMLTLSGLVPGVHTITLTAANSLGLMGNASIDVTVTSPQIEHTTTPTTQYSYYAAAIILIATATLVMFTMRGRHETHAAQD